MYGTPPFDAGNDDAATNDATFDAVPFYGGPPFDAGNSDAEADSSVEAGDAGDATTD